VTAVPIAHSFSVPHPPSSRMLPCQHFQVLIAHVVLMAVLVIALLLYPRLSAETDAVVVIYSRIFVVVYSDGTGCAMAAVRFSCARARHKVKKYRDQEW